MSDYLPGLRGRRDECEALGRLVEHARAGRSQVLVLRGEAGVGKTALLDYLLERASGCRVARAAGSRSETELPLAGLHQLCAPLMDRAARLPGPQRDTLGKAFGLSAGEPPDRFLLGLAVLRLLAEAAGDEPVVCVVDDAQWLDRVSAQMLAFVARRLGAERVAVVFAVREPSRDEALAGLPELTVKGLDEGDARALLDSAVRGPMDERVRDRIVDETRGNPLALLELPRGLTPAQLAGGFGLLDALPPAGRLEQGLEAGLEPLPAATRRLLLAAAAEPVGDAALLWRAVERLGIGADAAIAAEAAGLLDIGARVRFRHSVVRSAVYRSASPAERQAVHGALAEVTEPDLDPDRRAWHRAHATPVPDEDVAAALERSAGRAQARGGLAAAAAFLERAAKLTPEPAARGRRGLAAARAKREAGALDAAVGLALSVEAGPTDALRTAELERLRGEIAFDQRRGGDAARLLLGAARRLEPLDAGLARETHLEAVGAAIWADGPGDRQALIEAAAAARAAPPAGEPALAADLVLDALAIRSTEGFPAAAPALERALAAVCGQAVGSEDVGRWLWLAGDRAGGIVALELWDFESWHELAAHQVQVARDAGALVQLQHALNPLAGYHVLAGELSAAAVLMDEDRLVAEATGNPPVGYGAMLLAAMRGREAEASELIQGVAREATARGQGRLVSFAAHAGALLDNGLGRHDAARDAAWQAFRSDVVGYGCFIAPELAEAAARTGDGAQLAAALDWVSQRARLARTDWALGIEARIRALAGEGDAAERHYRESIECLGRTRARVEHARSQLLFGEWLRSEGRRADAREQLRAAHDRLVAMGVEAFAERARRELQATGETARTRTVEISDELTAQEAQIARLARDGLSNPEIGNQLFLSPRTVEWHLHKVFGKLGIRSRRQLPAALAEAERTAVPA